MTEQPADEPVASVQTWEQQEESLEEEAAAPAQPVIAPTPSSGEWRRRKKHRSRGKNAENDWQQEERQMLRFSRRIPLPLLWGAAGLVSVTIAVALFLLLRTKQDQVPVMDPGAMTFIDPMTAVKEKEDATAATAARLSQINEAHAAIEAFFRTASVEELMPQLRSGDDLEEKVRQYYANRSLPDPLYDSMEKTTSTLLAEGKFLQIQILLKDKTSRLMTLFKSGDRYLIDWESWVGWCQMDFQTFTQKKPVTPVEVRVLLEGESYYNYDFPSSAEKDWQSYRLIFEGEERILHGYVPRLSALHQEVALPSELSTRAMTLRIRYRDEDSHFSQVLIDSVVSDSWVKGLPKE